MNHLLSIEKRNSVLNRMAKILEQERANLKAINQQDLNNYTGDDLAMEKRLLVDDAKIDGMILSLQQLASQEDPIGVERFHFVHDNGIKITNKTAAFGTIMIIYESRPDVTVEAGGIAFKSGNKILLKGGKESLGSNLKIVELWHQALTDNNVATSWVEYLNYDRTETQAFLEKPTQKVDLIVPRGGENLIAFVKKHATCPVIISGRGNNFVYVNAEANLEKATAIIINGKTSNISVCNALDKVLIDTNLDNWEAFAKKIISELQQRNVTVLGDENISKATNVPQIESELIWHEEFLDYKIVIGTTNSNQEAIDKINTYCGGHSASIITQNNAIAQEFMENVDTAAVYQNASTRFTDGGQFGLGGELAISTDKLHQRGPIGLQHLVTNKWYIYGDGQIR
ncbi:MAG: glutamate-5-semialdehyde dehydrogenase [Flavobacterium sp.]|uniref:glutamate-5-semialdehyde dehydrogenase n=2 Tax=Flavobacterium sp. TaxID=239 RepID=UPI001B5D096F|nr:glutamate-5-semialdehyde dehydrogenase [Flavobacterium sp.]MBP6145685.1 glutamate-5-semialdehyde dehydrogenase [Flavobacterium sp.]MBP7181435.1 glutamate-5-semialdehyde dehydrogenase [Flavobacterium sp.]MBP7317050.1 glutamate-5-semialdehyde dehydrogenase [Flavobacterium sp.]MBP8886871.1 glutamate-5-semialdehyde dehydrogenase [Flavobacterium sp.]